MTTFQAILIGAFIFIAVFATLVFAGIVPGFGSGPVGVRGEVEVWGTVPSTVINPIINTINEEERDVVRVDYREIPRAEYEAELIESLAAGEGPDLFLLPDEWVVKHGDKISPISYETVTERAFKDMFIEAGEIYLAEEGIMALPFIVDPLVMYWNRDMLSAAGIAAPPQYWDTVLTLAPRISESDEAANILQSTIAFGEYGNVTNAKEILAMLFMQAGDRIVERENGRVDVVLGNQVQGSASIPAHSALRFYTQFSNSANPVYSWNRSLPEAEDMFTSEKLALYIGFASALPRIQRVNPHLNVDVAVVPQIRDNPKRTTFASLLGLAIPRTSDNKISAAYVAQKMISQTHVQSVADALTLPPPRRDLLSAEQVEAEKAAVYEAAIIGRTWLDPNPDQTESIFERMINDVTSGRTVLESAVSTARIQINDLFQ